ncbi:MAG: phosphatidylglycerophosphatase A [Myxococcota bacterium]|nr:phosphatidylglycerophosphatase A [Myxococcota bacterium]
MHRKLILFFSSAGGLGYVPKAPGTFGTLAALPIWWLCADLSLPIYASICVVSTLFAVWISHRADEIYGSHDCGKIVIDEVVGCMVAAVGIPWEWRWVLATFILFRVLDILKPPPIRWFDRNLDGGLGVVLDDIVAGVIASGILNLAYHTQTLWLPWIQ